MAGGTVGLAGRMSALSGHFPASSLTDETDTTIGMNSLDPVMYPSEKPSTKASRVMLPTTETIDHTFQRLFACMSLAYNTSAKMEAPQFKAYKGLRISVKEKMRLNNIVWREWYLQFGKSRHNKKRAKICHFSAQMEHIHNTPTCVVLEGKYWKRSNEVVKNEYMKWRVFFKERMKHWKPETDQVPVVELLARVGRDGPQTISSFVLNQNIRAHYSPPELTKDDYKMDLSDDIFSTLQSVGFPHQTNRDLLHLESSDLMQPELIGLEPDLYLTDMEATEPLQELLADVMSIHMDMRFSTGLKRPVFSDQIFFTDTQPVPPPPAYPAVKRSRSSTVQAPVEPCHPLPETDIERIMIDDINPSVDLTSSSVYNILPTTNVRPENRLPIQPSVYNNSTQRDIYPSQLDNSASTLAATRVTSTMHNIQPLETSYQPSTQIQNEFSQHQRLPQQQLPAFNSSAHCDCFQQTSLPGRKMNGCIRCQISRQNVQSGVHKAVNTSMQTRSTNNSMGNFPNVYQLHNGEGYKSQNAVYSAGNAPNSFNHNTELMSPNLLTVSKLQEGSNTSGSNCLKSPGQSEFKKPEMKPKVVKPQDHEKSSFLTKLLQKPLDKETADAGSTPIHPVYFPTFTPISYTPQVTSPNQGTARGKAVAGKENNSSQSAEEDKKEAPSAERKRRIQIKTGFDALSSLVPTIATSTTTKTSKATMLTKTLEFIDNLQKDERQMQEEMDLLTNEIAALDHSISLCHGQLPATGVPMVSQHKDHMKSILKSYIVEQAGKNRKFYVFSKLMEPQFDSFYNMVSTSNIDDLYRSTQAWLDQYCSLASLRPALSGSLREICTETSILTDPAKFPEQAREALSISAAGKSPASTPTTTNNSFSGNAAFNTSSATAQYGATVRITQLQGLANQKAEFSNYRRAQPMTTVNQQPVGTGHHLTGAGRQLSGTNQQLTGVNRQLAGGYKLPSEQLSQSPLRSPTEMGPPTNFRANVNH